MNIRELVERAMTDDILLHEVCERVYNGVSFGVLREGIIAALEKAQDQRGVEPDA